MNEFAHKFCTQAVLDLLTKHKIFGNFAGNEKIFADILSGCVLPDIDEKSQGYAYHFYNPITNTNYLGSENHAKARVITHFARFILTKNWVEFGRAIHFLEDICTPVHTQYEDSSDAVFKLPLHVEFEREFDRFLEREVQDEGLEYTEICSLSRNIDDAALHSAENFSLYKKIRESDLNKKSLFQKIFEDAITAIHIACNYILLAEPYAQEIKHNDKIIGYFLDDDFVDSCVAANTDNYRIRLESNANIFIFKKAGTGRNFAFIEKRKLT